MAHSICARSRREPRHHARNCLSTRWLTCNRNVLSDSRSRDGVSFTSAADPTSSSEDEVADLRTAATFDQLLVRPSVVRFASSSSTNRCCASQLTWRGSSVRDEFCSDVFAVGHCPRSFDRGELPVCWHRAKPLESAVLVPLVPVPTSCRVLTGVRLACGQHCRHLAGCMHGGSRDLQGACTLPSRWFLHPRRLSRRTTIAPRPGLAERVNAKRSGRVRQRERGSRRQPLDHRLMRSVTFFRSASISASSRGGSNT